MEHSTHEALVRSVVIVGAGPAGLALARLLQMRAVEVTILERDESPASRPQGGSLDLRPDSGRRAIMAAGLNDDFVRLSREDAKQFTLVSSTGAVIPGAGEDTHEDAGPEIDRGDLRAMLLEAVTRGTVQWGRTVTEVAAADDGRWQVRCADGTTMTADLVVGADGIGSRVRSRLTSTTPVYVGRTMLAANLRRQLWRDSEVAELLGEGSVMFAGGQKTIFVQRCAHDLILMYFSMEVPERWPAEEAFDLDQTDDVLAAVKAAYSDWDPDLLEKLTQIDEGFQRWPLSAMPVGHRWDTVPGLTMIGDASHVMPPFTGKGVNLALFDALELAEALTTRGHADLREALEVFEAGMQAQTQRETAECLDVGLTYYGIDPMLAR
jgi:2-polyprenyl-6-methoxyphenol hydroxylase-like FAD-dependent oxidoreductase